MLLLAAGCKNREPRLVTHTLEVAPAVLSFAFDETGISKRIDVETDAPSFSFSVSYSGQETDWLETAQEETCITVSAASRNASDGERRATLTVSADRAASRTVVVTQGSEGEGTDYAVVLSPDSLELPAYGTLTEEAEIISAGSGFRAERAAGDTWYEVRIEKQRLIVTAAPNSSAEAREGAATVTNAEGGEAVLTIRQAGIPAAYGITLEPASLTFASSGDGLTKTVSVVTQGSVPAALVTSDQAEWLSAEIVEKQLLVTATVNDGGERRGEVTVTNAEGAFAVLEVTQQAAGDTGIAVEPAQLSFGPEGGRRTCGITAGGTELTAATDRKHRMALGRRDRNGTGGDRRTMERQRRTERNRHGTLGGGKRGNRGRIAAGYPHRRPLRHMAVAFALRHYGGLDEYLRIFRDGDHCPRKRRASPAAAYRGSAGRRPPSTSYCATVRRESPSEPLSERETSPTIRPRISYSRQESSRHGRSRKPFFRYR